MKLIKKLGIIAIGAVLMAGCTPKDATTRSSTESTAAESLATESGKDESKAENTDKDLKKIGVIQLVEHKSLDIIYNSFKDELKNLGYIDGENAKITFQNAQGDMSNITSIVQGFEGDKQDVVVGIATPVAQGAMSLTKSTPVVFSAVTDPIRAGILTDMNAPDKGMTGTSDAVQIDKIMDLALQISPDVKKVGFIYNPGEDNSVTNLGLLENYVKEKNLELETVSISTSADLQTAAATLFEKVDMIFVSNDNTVAEAMPILTSEAIKAKKPIYVGADSMVMDGGLATVGIDYTDLGKETAKMVDEIIKGKSVEEIPVKVFKDDLFIYVNTDTAAALGIEIPESIKTDKKFVEIK
nr:ABC transporter substrate-binding protein [uncultured Lachnoanaerobaculum sp.]